MSPDLSRLKLPLNPQPGLRFRVQTALLLEPPWIRDRVAQAVSATCRRIVTRRECEDPRRQQAEQVLSHVHVCIGSRDDGRILVSPWIGGSDPFDASFEGEAVSVRLSGVGVLVPWSRNEER